MFLGLAVAVVWSVLAEANESAFLREGDYGSLYPLFSIAIRLHNHAHALPYFFGLLENLDYPKDQLLIDIFIGPHIDATRPKAQQ